MPYDPDFLQGTAVPLPQLTPRVSHQSYLGGIPLERTNYSLVFNQVRGFAVYSAYNIDGDSLLEDGPDRAGFTLDPDIPTALQVDNDRGYRGFPAAADNPWDRGHLARRRALHWPDFATAERADRESSFYSNITPQHRAMNRQGGAWASVENFILELASAPMQRACVFAGPVFTDADHQWTNRMGELPIHIPSGHWKVVIVTHQGGLCAAAFLMWQCDISQCRPLPLDPVLEQVRINTVEYLSGLYFGDAIRAADPLRLDGGRNGGLIHAPADVML